MTEAKVADAGMALTQGVAVAAVALWEVPLILGCAWWSAFGQAFAHHHHSHRLEDHADEQLVVPEPFESEGEPGLFA